MVQGAAGNSKVKVWPPKKFLINFSFSCASYVELISQKFLR